MHRLLCGMSLFLVAFICCQEGAQSSSPYILSNSSAVLSSSEQAEMDRWLFRGRKNPNHGPSCKATCKVLNNGKCGTGTIVGVTKDGYSLVLTNAHVAGSRLGHIVTVDVESTGSRIKCRVIMAAYSDKYLADWAILKTTTKFSRVDPVRLNCERPSGSHYTKGFPRCKPMPAGDINMVKLSKNSSLAQWLPNSIGGQSGSGIFNDKTGYVEALLTWTWGGYGAGQMTSVMYKQALGRTVKGPLRIRDLIEISNTDDCCGSGIEKPESGFFAECDITDLDIWVNEPE